MSAGKMTKIGYHTCRGYVTETESSAGNPQKIYLFDGRFDTAYKVINFKIWGANWGSSSTNPDCVGKLSKNDIGVTSSSSFLRADDDNQIAWATSIGGIDGGAGAFAESIIDPDNLIIQDLYVYVRETGSGGVNYLVELEKYKIEGWQGALTMARDAADGE